VIAATRFGRPLPDGGTIGVAAAAKLPQVAGVVGQME
jgi:hypothetical protein